MDIDKIDIDNLSSEELDKAIDDLQDLIELSPLDYTPHSKQQTFHLSNKKVRILCGGNRSGKTESGTLECVFHATGLYPDWYPKELRLKTANIGRIVVEDLKIFGEVVEPKILKWLPSDLLIDKKKGMRGNTEKFFIRHSSGGTSTITVMSYEQDTEAFEGWAGHWAWFDEPPPYDKYVATIRGLVDYAGRMWMTLTPIAEPWLYDEFVVQCPDYAEIVYVSIYDNVNNLPGGDKEIKIFESTLPEEAREARMYGKFSFLTGRIYKNFDPLIHVVSNQNVKIDNRWPVYFVLDPADRRPHHGIWARIDPFGTIYIIDEIVFKGTILETSKEILKRELLNKINPTEVIRILDPNKGETPSAVSGLKLKAEFAKHAVYFLTKVNDDVTLGHLAVMEKLTWDKSKPLSTTNHPKLFFIKETTKECVRQLLMYVWDEWQGKYKTTRAEKEKPKDINKDMPDCVRYLVVFNPSFNSNRKEPDPRPYKSSSITGYR